jgi:hypothetical protein
MALLIPTDGKTAHRQDALRLKVVVHVSGQQHGVWIQLVKTVGAIEDLSAN